MAEISDTLAIPITLSREVAVPVCLVVGVMVRVFRMKGQSKQHTNTAYILHTPHGTVHTARHAALHAFPRA